MDNTRIFGMDDCNSDATGGLGGTTGGPPACGGTTRPRHIWSKLSRRRARLAGVETLLRQISITLRSDQLSQLLGDFLKLVQQSLSKNSTYDASGGTGSVSISPCDELPGLRACWQLPGTCGPFVPAKAGTRTGFPRLSSRRRGCAGMRWVWLGLSRTSPAVTTAPSPASGTSRRAGRDRSRTWWRRSRTCASPGGSAPWSRGSAGSAACQCPPAAAAASRP